MKYFGTDGFRGRANENLCVEHALKIGQFLGWYFGKHSGNKSPKCVIGKDTRRSSYMFEYALAAGLTSSGCDAYLMHVTSTPSVSYITKTEKFNFGIMITASHNPYHDNGIKIIDKDGYKMDEEVLAMAEQYIDGEISIEAAPSEGIGRCQDYLMGRNKYISYLCSIPNHSFRGYRIGLDCANGCASTLAKTVFDMLGADTYVCANTPDGFNINKDCGSTHMEKFRKFVTDNDKLFVVAKETGEEILIAEKEGIGDYRNKTFFNNGKLFAALSADEYSDFFSGAEGSGSPWIWTIDGETLEKSRIAQGDFEDIKLVSSSSEIFAYDGKDFFMIDIDSGKIEKKSFY